MDSVECIISVFVAWSFSYYQISPVAAFPRVVVVSRFVSPSAEPSGSLLANTLESIYELPPSDSPFHCLQKKEIPMIKWSLFSSFAFRCFCCWFLFCLLGQMNFFGLSHLIMFVLFCIGQLTSHSLVFEFQVEIDLETNEALLSVVEQAPLTVGVKMYLYIL